MCILIIKEMGAKFPSIERIKESMLNNPNGFSMAISNGIELTNFKTMSNKEFLNEYKKVIKLYDAKDVSMLIHARISTHGSNKIENCHCWIESDIAFAHNGVLSIKNRDDMTDSQTFFNDIFIPIYNHYGWDVAERSINAIIGTSKFGFLLKSGEIKRYGNFIHEDDGCFYSNDSYRRIKYNYSHYNRMNNYFDDVFGCYPKRGKKFSLKYWDYHF